MLTKEQYSVDAKITGVILTEAKEVYFFFAPDQGYEDQVLMRLTENGDIIPIPKVSGSFLQYIEASTLEQLENATIIEVQKRLPCVIAENDFLHILPYLFDWEITRKTRKEVAEVMEEIAVSYMDDVKKKLEEVFADGFPIAAKYHHIFFRLTRQNYPVIYNLLKQYMN